MIKDTLLYKACGLYATQGATETADSKRNKINRSKKPATGAGKTAGIQCIRCAAEKLSGYLSAECF